MITERERERVLRWLTTSRQTLAEAVEGLTDSQAHWTPAPGRWSIVEYVEHLAVADDGLIALIRASLLTPAQHDTEDQRLQRENKIRETPIRRGTNQAPAVMRPAGRFASLAEALEAFQAARTRSIEYARTTADDLRCHFAPHPVLGPLDGYQWLAGIARHAETHASHIREIRASDGFPLPE